MQKPNTIECLGHQGTFPHKSEEKPLSAKCFPSFGSKHTVTFQRVNFSMPFVSDAAVIANSPNAKCGAAWGLEQSWTERLWHLEYFQYFKIPVLFFAE